MWIIYAKESFIIIIIIIITIITFNNIYQAFQRRTEVSYTN